MDILSPVLHGAQPALPGEHVFWDQQLEGLASRWGGKSPARGRMLQMLLKCCELCTRGPACSVSSFCVFSSPAGMRTRRHRWVWEEEEEGSFISLMGADLPLPASPLPRGILTLI